MRELTMEEVQVVSGGTPTVAGVAAAGAAVAVVAAAAVGAFFVGYAIGTLINKAIDSLK